MNYFTYFFWLIAGETTLGHGRLLWNTMVWKKPKWIIPVSSVLREIIGNYAGIVFANSEEARALCHFSSKESPASATRYLSHFVPLVSVTDGPRGSYIGIKGEAVYIPPSPCVPVDTCGAGDAYASGILYSFLRGVSDVKGMGTLAAKVAATVVRQQGTRLSVHDAVELAESFAFHLNSSTIRSDIGSDHISSLWSGSTTTAPPFDRDQALVPT